MTSSPDSSTTKTQVFSVVEGINTNLASSVSDPSKFLILENCRVDNRLGQVIPRGGTIEEPAAAYPYTPLGMGHLVERSDSAVPIKNTIIASFSNGIFRAKSGNEWRAIYLHPNTISQPDITEERQHTFSQIGANTPVFISAGVFAKWTGENEYIDRVGIVPPSSAPTAIVTVSAGSITLTSGTRYIITYYNSATGLESDWSELSIDTGAFTSKNVTITFPSVPTDLNFDKVRIYRTLDGGIYPYLVDEITTFAAVTPYTDSKTDAQLTLRASARYEKSLPPSKSYLCAPFAQRIWCVDGNNPSIMQVSEPYTGSANSLEYYPPDNSLTTNYPVTGFVSVPNKLIVFHPRAIYYVSGYSDFQYQPLVHGVGTLYHHSIATNGKKIIFLSEEGWMSLDLGGGGLTCISRNIENTLLPILSASYSSGIHVSACWNPVYRQFITSVSLYSNPQVDWEDDITGEVVTWEDDISFAAAIWEDDVIGSNESLRVLCYGVSLESDSPQWHRYNFADFADNNQDGHKITYLYHPQPDENTIGTVNNFTYMGVIGPNFQRIVSTFRGDTTNDTGNPFTYKLLTGKIVVGAATGNYKLYKGLAFDTAYTDPMDLNADIKYLIDYDDPHLRDYQSQLITIPDNGRDIKKFPRMLARHIHLYIEGESEGQTRGILSKFSIQYNERLRRGGR